MLERLYTALHLQELTLRGLFDILLLAVLLGLALNSPPKAMGNTISLRSDSPNSTVFNNEFLEDFEKGGMISTGINPDSGLVEIMEQTDHPWFIGTQFHPEYRSTVLNPHPLFVDFIKAAKTYSK